MPLSKPAPQNHPRLKVRLRLAGEPAAMIYVPTRFLTNLVSAIVAAVLVLAAPLSMAQGLAPPLPANEAFRMEAFAAPEGGMELRWQIEEGYYLYRELLAAEAADGSPLALSTGPGKVKEDPNFGATEIYYGEAEATLPATDGPVTVTYQGCQEDGLCYPPIRETLDPSELAIAPASSMAGATGGGVLAANKLDNGREVSAGTAGAGALTLDSGASALVGGLAERGGPLLVLAAFLGFGLLLAFTPCVLPMVPIVAAMLAREGEGLTPRRGVWLTGIYVLAMASAFGLLGVVAAWSGQNLQFALQSPLTLGFLAAVFVALALSMFGLYELRLPSAFSARLEEIGSSRRGSAGGAAALGFTSALIMGPCVTAPLAGALLYIAQTGDVALGAAALFALGIGEGLPLLAVGIFGARVLPRSGAWMETVKLAFGFVFLGSAVWLMARLVPGPVELALWAVLLLVAAVFLGATDALPARAGGGHRAGKALGLAAMFLAGLLGLGAASGADDPLRPLAGLRATTATEADSPAFATVTTEAALDASLASANPALLYVTADWCVTCRTIERRVLPDPQTRAALAGLSLVEVDVTEFDAEGQALLSRLEAVGPPTMIFLDATRREPAGTRIVGMITPDAIAASAAEVR